MFQFKKAILSFNVDNLQDQEIHMLFNMFDTDRDGIIDYEYFIRILRVSAAANEAIGRDERLSIGDCGKSLHHFG